MFKVLRYFIDLQDDRHTYNVGDTYPREGYTPTKQRINELSGSDNKLCMPLIRLEVVEEKAAENGTNHNKRVTKRDSGRPDSRVSR